MKDFLVIMGGVFCIFVAFFLIVCLCSALGEWIRHLRTQYRIKHRFDKPPTAKCYCVDCVHHDDKTKQCYRFGETTNEYRCTADNWFCWEASPHAEIKEDK